MGDRLRFQGIREDKIGNRGLHRYRLPDACSLSATDSAFESAKGQVETACQDGIGQNQHQVPVQGIVLFDPPAATAIEFYISSFSFSTI